MSQDLFWFIPKWPFPPTDGAKRANVALMKGAGFAGARVHLLCWQAQDGEGPSIPILNSRFLNQPPPRFLSRLWDLARSPLTPVTFAPYLKDALVDEARAFLKTLPTTTPIVVDGLHAGVFLLRLAPSNPVVYRAHNVECDLWLRAAQSKKNPLFRLFLFFQATRVRALETQMLRLATRTFTVSPDDARRLKELYPKDRIETLPIGLDESPLPAPPDSHTFNLLFVGRLDWPPNRDGLKWFLEQVWPRALAQRPNLRLHIVGSGDSDWLKPFLSLNGVEFHGRVPSVTNYYLNSHLSLIPIFYGSGTRVKAIESGLLARPMLTTRLGIEGLPLENRVASLIEDTADAWINTLSEITVEECKKLGQHARAALENDFDVARIGARFFKAVFEE